MLRKIRITLATLFFVGITALFLDFTGVLPAYFGWMAKIQFVPALLALNAAIVAGLLLLTFLFGRVYCSTICPLGVMQDIISWMAGKKNKRRFTYSKSKNVLRTTMLVLFVVALVANVAWLASFIEPYSAYGRMVNNLIAPLYGWGNNLLAYLAERADSYLFYTTDVWLKSIGTLAVAAVTFIVIAILAWRNGRTWCNTICPVGTVLGFLSRFSLLKPRIDTAKCNGCGLCERGCKAACIDSKNHKIDYSRCVTCMDCLENCKKGAFSYGLRYKKQECETAKSGDELSRRSFISATTIIAASSLVKAEEQKIKGSLAAIEDKKIPERSTRIVPPGAKSIRNMTKHCTSCQLCVTVCPNEVLRPSNNLSTLMQPEMSYERGYCRPECTKCSEVCPTGAISLITKEEKSSTQIGHAIVIRENCVALTDNVSCGNCARHCPVGAITMVASEQGNKKSPKVPVVNVERCIGCGACEHLCPARPLSAIYVDGHNTHRTI
jgi:formate hydrogenlyase subunit 6/NADH:ubiquinone oxidoreductase subunit I